MNEDYRRNLNLEYHGLEDMERMPEEGEFSLAKALLQGILKPAGPHLTPPVPMVKTVTQLDREP